MFRWFDRNDIKRLSILQLQTLRKVNYLMASWAEVKGYIDELKGKWAKISEELSKVHAKLDECLKKEHIDPAELDAVKGDLVSVIGDMNDHLHADGM